MGLSPLLCAAEKDPVPVVEQDRFDPKINSWAEGTLMSMEVEGPRFSIRGTKRPYASAYAKMLKEMHVKTSRLSAEESFAKTAEIRAAWQPELEKARKLDAGPEVNFTFRLPAKEGMFSYFDESAYYNDGGGRKDNPTQGVKLTQREHAGMMALKDLRVGEYVVVGYDSGILYNDAYVVIKAHKPAGLQASTDDAVTPRKTGSVLPSDAPGTRLDPDTETARQIRRALVDDKELSIAAKNVTIEVEKGIAHLKGSVKTEQEKLEVEKKAAEIAGPAKVMSHLEVAAK